MNLNGKKGLHIIVPSFDGYLYILDPVSGCIDKVDIGEKSYAQVLADDITGNGKMDLLVSTMNGNIYCLGTQVPYHPLKAVPFQIQSVNGFANRYNFHGIFVSQSSREMRDAIGSTFKIEFSITDKRRLSKDSLPRRYRVKVLDIINSQDLNI